MKLELVENLLVEASTVDINNAIKQLQPQLPNYTVKVVSGGIGIYPTSGYIAKIIIWDDKETSSVRVDGVYDVNQHLYKTNDLQQAFDILNNNPILNLKEPLNANDVKKNIDQNQQNYQQQDQNQDSEQTDQTINDSLNINNYNILNEANLFTNIGQKIKDKAAQAVNTVKTAANNIKGKITTFFGVKRIADYIKGKMPDYDIKLDSDGIKICPKTGYIAKVILESINLTEDIKIQTPAGNEISVTDLNAVVQQLTGKEGSLNIKDMDQDQRDGITKSEMSQEIQDALDKKDWATALNKASAGKEKQSIIDFYLKDYENRKKITLNDLEKQMLSKWISELGFETRVNPFLNYIAIAKQKSGVDFGSYILGVINNAYAKNKLSMYDLQGRGTYGEAHLIFKKNWILSDDSPEYILNCYLWLSDSRNMNSLDLVSIHDTANLGKLPESYKSIKTGVQPGLPNPKEFNINQTDTIFNRNCIIYQTSDGKDTDINLGIQPAASIELALTFDAKNVDRKSNNLNVLEVKKAYDKLSKEDKIIFQDQLAKETKETK